MLLVDHYFRSGSYNATARHFEVAESTVKRWVIRYSETGDVESIPRRLNFTVRTSLFIGEALRIVDEGTRDLPYGVESWCALHRELLSRGLQCSRRTLARALKPDIILRVVQRKPRLTQQHKDVRVRFCKDMSGWSEHQLDNIIWCDEKKFTCKKSTKNTYLCRRSDPVKEQLGELEAWVGGDGIMVWIGVSIKHGFHLHIFPNRDEQGNRVTVNGAVFEAAMTKRNGLLNYLHRHRAVVAMDNCPAHNLARRTFQQQNVRTLPWPAKSPDLNPIENLWNIMDQHKDRMRPRNRADLLSSIESAYEALQTDLKSTCVKTIKSVSKRFQIVIEKKGGNCGY